MSEERHITGGPAFPGGVNQVYTNMEPGDPTQEGMSLRDYFAAKALPAILEGIGHQPKDQFYPMVASAAYKLADAMLLAREEHLARIRGGKA